MPRVSNPKPPTNAVSPKQQEKTTTVKKRGRGRPRKTSTAQSSNRSTLYKCPSKYKFFIEQPCHDVYFHKKSTKKDILESLACQFCMLSIALCLYIIYTTNQYNLSTII